MHGCCFTQDGCFHRILALTPNTLVNGDGVCSPQRVSHDCRNGLMGAPDCLQRHFCVFAVSFPGQEALTSIYNTILAQHLSFRSAPLVIQRLSSHLVTAALGKPRPLPFQPGSETCCLWAGRASYFPPGKYFIYSSESRYIYIEFFFNGALLQPGET